MRHPRIERGFDEIRFGSDRTLNLRQGLPTADQAVARANTWLREQQALRAGEVLVITGRGAGSVDGIGVIREAVLRLFPMLRRQNVIVGYHEHNAGAFVVQLASLRALVEAPRRHRHPTPRPVRDPEAVRALDVDMRTLLRRLARTALEALGIQRPTEAFVQDEMMRQFSRLVAPIPDGPGREIVLRQALERAIEEYQ